MSSVRITVAVGTRVVSLDQITDVRLAAAFRAAGTDVARRLQSIRCPVHGEAARRVRIHFDARGNADLKYDSCCEQLGQSIGAALG